MITRPDQAFFFVLFFFVLVSTLLFSPHLESKNSEKGRPGTLSLRLLWKEAPPWPSGRLGQVAARRPTEHRSVGNTGAGRRGVGAGGGRGEGRSYFLITSSLSLSARCFLFWSFFLSSADASWCRASRALRRVSKQTKRKNAKGS